MKKKKIYTYICTHTHTHTHIYMHIYILQFQGFTGPLKPGYKLLSKTNSKDFLNLRSYEYLYSWLIITLKSCIPPLEEYALLVHLGSYGRIPQTGWLINNRNLFLTVLGAESLRPGCRHDWNLMRALFWAETVVFSLCSHSIGRRLGSSLGLFYKGTNPVHEGSTLMTYSPSKGPLLQTSSRGGLGFNI